MHARLYRPMRKGDDEPFVSGGVRAEMPEQTHRKTDVVSNKLTPTRPVAPARSSFGGEMTQTRRNFLGGVAAAGAAGLLPRRGRTSRRWRPPLSGSAKRRSSVS